MLDAFFLGGVETANRRLSRNLAAFREPPHPPIIADESAMPFAETFSSSKLGPESCVKCRECD